MIENLPHQSLEKPLKDFAQKVLVDFAGNITAICVTGSALTADFVPRKSGINTVLVFENESIELLDIVSGLGRMLFKHNFDIPLIMTGEHISRSQDVFGVEYLDFQLNHTTIWGSDPFESLMIEKGDVRLQCERELKANLIRLRQGYIASKLGTAKLREVLVSGARGLMPYLRAMLWLCGKPRAAEIAATIEDAAKEFAFDGTHLACMASWKYDKTRTDAIELRESASYLYNLTNSLAEWVDRCDV